MSKYNFTPYEKPPRNTTRLYDGFNYNGRYIIFSLGLKADFGDNVSIAVDTDNSAFCIKVGGDYKILQNQGKRMIYIAQLKNVMPKGRYIAVPVDHNGGAIYQLAKDAAELQGGE